MLVSGILASRPTTVRCAIKSVSAVRWKSMAREQKGSSVATLDPVSWGSQWTDMSAATQRLFDLEAKAVSTNYHSTIPVSLSRAKGCWVYDVDGNAYLDFLSAYSAVNQGHCHPRLVNAMTEQLNTLTLTSRAFRSDQLPLYADMITSMLGFEKVLPMNTGVEAGETAVKLARKWAYQVKKVAPNQAKVVFAKNNFWGRSLAAVSSSTDPEAWGNFGPLMPNFQTIDYDNVPALEAAISDPNTAAFMVEPVQGEGGVIVPSPEYFAQVTSFFFLKLSFILPSMYQRILTH